MLTTELRYFLCLFALAVGLLTPRVARAHDDSSTPPTLILVDDKTDKAWLSDARAKYPIDTCVVSGERLDDHAESKRLDIIYREPRKIPKAARRGSSAKDSSLRRDRNSGTGGFLNIQEGQPC